MEKAEQLQRYSALKAVEAEAGAAVGVIMAELPMEQFLRLNNALKARDLARVELDGFCQQHAHAAVQATRELLTESGATPEVVEEYCLQTMMAFQRAEMAERLAGPKG